LFLVVLSGVFVWGRVAVFSDGSGYVFFRGGGGVAVYSIDGRLVCGGWSGVFGAYLFGAWLGVWRISRDVSQ